MDSTPAGSWRRSLAFVGANPGLALHPVDARGPDSRRGSRLLLARYFPEAARFPLNGITHTQDEFDVELDLERGFRAVGRKAELELSGILDRRPFSAPDFQLGSNSAALNNVYVPCSSGRLAEFGVEWPGAASVYPGPRGPSSSGYIALAESWVM